VQGRVLVPGEAAATSLKLSAPISFWGGIDPRTARVADPRHPEHDLSISGRVLVVPETVGSSSSSAILLELLRLDIAPAAIVLGHSDAILVLGVLVGEELGYATIPVVELNRSDIADLPDGAEVSVGLEGTVSWSNQPA